MNNKVKIRGLLCGALLGTAILCLLLSAYATLGCLLLAGLVYPGPWNKPKQGAVRAALIIIAVLLIVLGVLLAGADAGCEPMTMAVPTATAEPTPEATSELTLSATPEPTPTTAPTPEATPEPVPTATPEPQAERKRDAALSFDDSNESRAVNGGAEGVYTYTVNKNSMKFHMSWCSAAASISDENRSYETGTYQDLISRGYSPCKSCSPY